MALLGHSVRLRITTTDVDASVQAWLDAGFQPLGSQAATVDTRELWLTDGQIVVELVHGEHGVPTIVYGNTAPTRTAQQCKDRGAPGIVSADALLLQGLGRLPIAVESMPMDAGVHADGDQNPVLGYFDHLVVHVADLDAAKRWSESVGLLVLDQYDGEHPTINVTDGATTISLRTLPIAGIPLEYSADLDHEVVEYLRETFGTSCHVVDDADGNPMVVRLVMPEGTMIMIGRDD